MSYCDGQGIRIGSDRHSAGFILDPEPMAGFVNVSQHSDEANAALHRHVLKIGDPADRCEGREARNKETERAGSQETCR